MVMILLFCSTMASCVKDHSSSSSLVIEMFVCVWAVVADMMFVREYGRYVLIALYCM